MAGSSIDRTVVEQIVRDVVLSRLGRNGNGNGSGRRPLAVHASARHIHLSREDLDVLFGPGYKLTEERELYQPGNFAAKETVTLVGPRSRLISNLRILGPLRKDSQIELAFTDAVSLGFDDIPVRISGNIEGTPGALITGPKGHVQMKKGLIRAAIHVHMNPDDAKLYGVKQGDVMKLRVGGDAGVTFNRVHVRIDPKSLLNVHMDTDEANACGLHLAKDIELFK
jgi:putative phosphotransacetylase